MGMERKCLPGWEVVYAKALRWGSLVLGGEEQTMRGL